MLTKEFVAESKKKLLQERALLEEEVEKLKKTGFGHDGVDDEEAKASEVEQIENNGSVADVYSARLVDIDSALEKIESGSYGRCEKCGKELSEEVLRLDPESRLCENCR